MIVQHGGSWRTNRPRSLKTPCRFFKVSTCRVACIGKNARFGALSHGWYELDEEQRLMAKSPYRPRSSSSNHELKVGRTTNWSPFAEYGRASSLPHTISSDLLMDLRFNHDTDFLLQKPYYARISSIFPVEQAR